MGDGRPSRAHLMLGATPHPGSTSSRCEELSLRPLTHPLIRSLYLHLLHHHCIVSPQRPPAVHIALIPCFHPLSLVQLSLPPFSCLYDSASSSP